MQNNFGMLLRGLREQRRISLRKFAESIGMDPSNYSRIERGEVAPPGEDVLSRIACGLGIEPGLSDEWYNLKFQADTERHRIPDEVMAQEEVAASLPAFFALLREGKARTPEEMYEAMSKIISNRRSSSR